MAIAESTEVLPSVKVENKVRKYSVYATWFIILFVPTYSLTETDITFYGPITEESYLWPWMILTRYTPREDFNADQFAVVGFPWSFLLFIPFFYAFKSAWELYKTDENRLINSGTIILTSLVQIFLLFMTYQSQSDGPGVSETVQVFYIPQITVILLHLVLVFRWAQSDLKAGRTTESID